MRRLFSLLLLAATAAGCALPQGTPFPTPWPAGYVPTVVAMTAQAMASPTRPATRAPTDTLAPVPSASPVPSETPTLPTIAATYLYFLTVTATPTPAFGRAQVEIYAPGPLSKVISPIHLRSYLSPDAVGTTRVELFGEDGRLLTRIIKHTESEFFQYDRLAIDVPYEIGGAAELGRLQISSEDRKGITKTLASVHILLLSDGRDEITPTGDLGEACLFISPVPGSQVAGGTVALQGRMRPFNASPVYFELIDQYGAPLASRIQVFAPPDGSYQSFSTSIPYKVSVATPGYLVVRQSDDRIQGPMYLFRQPITLNP